MFLGRLNLKATVLEASPDGGRGKSAAALSPHLAQVTIAEFVGDVLMYQRRQRMITDEATWRPWNSEDDSGGAVFILMIMLTFC